MRFSALQLALAISGSQRPEKDFNPAQAPPPCWRAQTVMARRCQWLILPLSLASHQGWSAVACLAERCNYTVLLLAVLDHWNFSAVVCIKQGYFCIMRMAQKEPWARMWGGLVCAHRGHRCVNVTRVWFSSCHLHPPHPPFLRWAYRAESL